MRLHGYLGAALLLVLAGASPALARVAMIETAAPIQDRTQDAVRTALKEAVDTAAKGAVAMGLPWVQVRNAVVLEDSVAVQVLATDQTPSEANGNDSADGAPGEKAVPGGGDHVNPDRAGPRGQPPSPAHPGLSHL